MRRSLRQVPPAAVHSRFAYVLLLVASFDPCAVAQSGGPLAPPNSDYRWATANAVERWHDLKFGLRIHWGTYAINGIGPESWPLNANRQNASFLDWYWEQGLGWAPSSFDAQSWIDLMNRAGMHALKHTHPPLTRPCNAPGRNQILRLHHQAP